MDSQKGRAYFKGSVHWKVDTGVWVAQLPDADDILILQVVKSQ